MDFPYRLNVFTKKLSYPLRDKKRADNKLKVLTLLA